MFPPDAMPLNLEGRRIKVSKPGCAIGCPNSACSWRSPCAEVGDGETGGCSMRGLLVGVGRGSVCL
jgi:hypothetical protein